MDACRDNKEFWGAYHELSCPVTTRRVIKYTTSPPNCLSPFIGLILLLVSLREGFPLTTGHIEGEDYSKAPQESMHVGIEQISIGCSPNTNDGGGRKKKQGRERE